MFSLRVALSLCVLHHAHATNSAGTDDHATLVVCLPTCHGTAAGATGGVGKRVVQRLLAEGKVVRALVRDVDKAKELLVSRVTEAGLNVSAMSSSE